jgi:hypothetical protein
MQAPTVVKVLDRVVHRGLFVNIPYKLLYDDQS